MEPVGHSGNIYNLSTQEEHEFEVSLSYRDGCVFLSVNMWSAKDNFWHHSLSTIHLFFFFFFELRFPPTPFWPESLTKVTRIIEQ